MVWLSAISLASVVESIIKVCRWDFQKIGQPAYMIMNPVCDLAVAGLLNVASL